MNELLIVVPIKNEKLPYIPEDLDCDIMVSNAGKKLDKLYSKYTVFEDKNLSIPNTVTLGIKHAQLMGYKYIMFIDGGNRYGREDIPKVYHAAIKSNADVTIGSRYVNKSQTEEIFIRNFFRVIIRKMFHLVYKNNIQDWTHAFRIYKIDCLDKELVNAIWKRDFKTGQGIHLFLLSYLLNKGKIVHEVPIHYTKSVGRIRLNKIIETLRVWKYAYNTNKMSRI
jgi:glycosyltransferase involved in cell wall biosynthesis